MDKVSLREEIETEIENLARLVKEMKEITDKSVNKLDSIETRATGSILYDFPLIYSTNG